MGPEPITLDVEYLLNAEDWKTFYIHDKAMAEIGAMFTRVAQVKERFGAGSEEYQKMVDSLHACLSKVFTRTGFSRHMAITADGPLSLYCNENNAFVFGMVFFRDRAYDDTPDKPQPGDWSLHS